MPERVWLFALTLVLALAQLGGAAAGACACANATLCGPLRTHGRAAPRELLNFIAHRSPLADWVAAQPHLTTLAVHSRPVGCVWPHDETIALRACLY